MHEKLSIDDSASRKLERFISKLLSKYEVRSIVLFGSAVKGTWNYRSDIDILIVSDSMGNDWHERNLNAQMLSEGKVQPFVIPSDELESAIDNRRYIVWEALYDGVIIKDDGVFADVRRRFLSLIDDGRLIHLDKGWKTIRSW